MRHPKKEVQEALEEIMADGWFRLEPGGHKLRRQALNCRHRTERGATET